MLFRVLLIASIALGGLFVTACESSSLLAAEPGGATPPPIAQASPAAPHTPSGIYFSTSVRPTLIPTIAAATLPGNSHAVIIQGRVYNVEEGQHLTNAAIEWQFLALDWQRYNGRLQVSDDGLYRLMLPIRDEDEVIITASAPGYLSSTARLMGKQLNRYGSHLNFGLVKANGPVPTLPGALGTVQLSGIVYNSARGPTVPIANARVLIVIQSLVEPETPIEATTGITGTFVIPLALHSTDQLDVTIAASGYQTVTLTEGATDLASKPQLSIGLMPAFNP